LRPRTSRGRHSPQLALRVSDVEAKWAGIQASAAGVSVSAWARDRLFRGLRATEEPKSQPAKAEGPSVQRQGSNDRTFWVNLEEWDTGSGFRYVRTKP
jgi:hypothetical protein